MQHGYRAGPTLPSCLAGVLLTSRGAACWRRYQSWNDYNPYMPFVETLNEDHQRLLTGSQQYGGGRSARDIDVQREHTGWGLGFNAPPK